MNLLSIYAPMTPPTTEPLTGSAAPSDASPARTVSDVIGGVFDALADNGYQTGVALVVAAVAIVAMVNIRSNRFVIAIVGVGAFWAGWLGYNTATGENNQLFPADVNATKLWDIALTSDTNFLLVCAVGSVAAIFLWRSSIKLPNRIMLMAGAVLGASFLYNMYEAVRGTSV